MMRTNAHHRTRKIKGTIKTKAMKKTLHNITESARILASYAIYRLSGRRVMTATARRWRARAMAANQERIAAMQASLDEEHLRLRGWNVSSYPFSAVMDIPAREAQLRSEIERAHSKLQMV